MTAPSPAIAAGSRVAFTIAVKAKGDAKAKPIDSSWQVVRVETWSNVNRVPRAQVVLYDGSPSKSTFVISATDTLLPGNELQITAAYDDATQAVLFSGVIVKQGIEIGEAGASRLVVDVTDPAMKMALDRRSAVFPGLQDSALIEKLITASGLTPTVTATRAAAQDTVQCYASDWDLMVTRAEVNGMVVLADGGTVTVAPPDTGQTAVLAVKYGESVLDLRAEMDASSQLASAAIKSFGWDPGEQKVVESGPGTVTVTAPGDVTSDALAGVFDVKSFARQTGGAVEKDALEAWSSAELVKRQLAKVRGWVRFQGSSAVKPGKVIQLDGLGPRFNGGAWVSGVHHSISQGRWLTTAEFGLSPKWFAAESPNIQAPPASGQLPGVQGLQTGIVKQVAKDPGGEFRVQVNLPLVGDAAAALVWARLSTFYAGNRMGALFYPEPEDEVIVGFMNDDPRFAVILGSVYSKQRVPPYPPDEKNDVKALRTRGELELKFDDKDRILEIRTARHSIRLDDKGDEVVILDGSGNRLSMARGGVTLESASNLTLTARGNITIDAQGNLALKAAATASVDASAVQAKAKVKLSAGSGGMSELTASGLVKVQGSIVKIN
jgi:Rhs element Vgr protein